MAVNKARVHATARRISNKAILEVTTGLLEKKIKGALRGRYDLRITIKKGVVKVTQTSPIRKIGKG